MTDSSDTLRLLEAALFASARPVGEDALAVYVREGEDVRALLAELQRHYRGRGVNLVRVAEKWAFRTAPDLAGRLRVEKRTPRKLSRAALETLAIVAYYQPVTRAEIEEIRSVSHSRGTLDVLLEAGWVKPGRRRRSPGRPLTWQTTEAFLDDFGLEGLENLPGIDDLKAAGLLDKRPAIAAFPREDLESLSEAEARGEDQEEEEMRLSLGREGEE